MADKYTPRQGQFLAFIYYYTKIHGCSPSELDMQRYFQISAPAIHQMVVKLEAGGGVHEGSPGVQDESFSIGEMLVLRRLSSWPPSSVIRKSSRAVPRDQR